MKSALIKLILYLAVQVGAIFVVSDLRSMDTQDLRAIAKQLKHELQWRDQV